MGRRRPTICRGFEQGECPEAGCSRTFSVVAVRQYCVTCCSSIVCRDGRRESILDAEPPPRFSHSIPVFDRTGYSNGIRIGPLSYGTMKAVIKADTSYVCDETIVTERRGIRKRIIRQYRVCTIIVRDRYGLMVKWFCKAYGDVLGCAISLGRFFVTLMVMQSHLRRDGSLR